MFTASLVGQRPAESGRSIRRYTWVGPTAALLLVALTLLQGVSETRSALKGAYQRGDQYFQVNTTVDAPITRSGFEAQGKAEQRATAAIAVALAAFGLAYLRQGDEVTRDLLTAFRSDMPR